MAGEQAGGRPWTDEESSAEVRSVTIKLVRVRICYRWQQFLFLLCGKRHGLWGLQSFKASTLLPTQPGRSCRSFLWLPAGKVMRTEQGGSVLSSMCFSCFILKILIASSMFPSFNQHLPALMFHTCVSWILWVLVCVWFLVLVFGVFRICVCSFGWRLLFWHPLTFCIVAFLHFVPASDPCPHLQLGPVSPELRQLSTQASVYI